MLKITGLFEELSRREVTFELQANLVCSRGLIDADPRERRLGVKWLGDSVEEANGRNGGEPKGMKRGMRR